MVVGPRLLHLGRPGRTLSPGQVRYDSVSQDGGASAVTVSMARFEAEAVTACDTRAPDFLHVQ